jgi:DNA-binding transcriptional MocR family regulator
MNADHFSNLNGSPHFAIDRNLPVTLSQQIFEHFRARIQTGKLGLGSKLFSIRELAKRLKVNKSCVVDAYERLATEGYICPRGGSGFFVTFHANLSVALTIPCSHERRIQCALFSVEVLSECWRDVASMVRNVCHTGVRLQHATQIQSSLFECWKADLDQHGFSSPTPTQLNQCGNLLEGIRSVLRNTCAPESTVAVEAPVSVELGRFLREDGWKVVPVEFSNNFEDLQNNLKQSCVKAIVIFPDGSTLDANVSHVWSAHRRHAILGICERLDAHLIECYEEYGLANSAEIGKGVDVPFVPTLAQLDAFQRVSVIVDVAWLFPLGMGSGFVLSKKTNPPCKNGSPKALTFRPQEAKQFVFLNQVLLQAFERHSMRNLMSLARKTLRVRREKVLALLRDEAPNGTTFVDSGVGFWIWLNFPKEMSLLAMRRELDLAFFDLSDSVFEVPFPQGVRLSLAFPDPLEYFKQLKLFFGCMENALGAPPRHTVESQPANSVG